MTTQGHNDLPADLSRRQESYDLLTKSDIDDIMTDADTLKNHMDEIIIMIEELDDVIREEE